MKIIITGREQDLSIAEAESRFGSIQVFNNQAIGVNTDSIDINSLGGAIKIAEPLGTLDADQQKIIKFISDFLKKSTLNRKFNFGISAYSNKPNFQQIGMKVKRQLRALGLNPRLVQTQDATLNAATIIHNKLLDKGFEILLIDCSAGVIVARSIGVQNIDAYSKRDYQKPCRDNTVGMLPPKLSQILINLSQPTTNSTIVDPFCGSGGLLMEAGLMGYDAEGSDINPKMAKCCATNMDWLNNEFKLTRSLKVATPSDATTRTYQFDDYRIASEGFLGENFTSQPTMRQLNNQMDSLRGLYLNFFDNLQKQSTTPDVIAICAPCWALDNQVVYLDIIDDIIKLGYTYFDFKAVRSNVLSYYRKGQYTGRQILVFRNKQEK